MGMFLKIDAARLPSDLETGSQVLIPLSDGTTRVLRNSPRDLMLRSLLAGEPMVDPTPAGYQ